MSRWWRAYDECVDDEKLLLLSDKQHRVWFNLLCLASKNNGRLPTMEVICLKLRMSETKVLAFIEELKERNLLDEIDGEIEPHNWNGRQYKSDVSTERVQRHRERKRNVSVTTPENRVQNTESEKKEESRAGRLGDRTAGDQEFEEFWKAYPKREGPNPKAEARKAFSALMKRGVNPASIVAAVKKFAVAERATIGTRFLPHASTWLRGQRFEDYLGPPPTAGPPQPPAQNLPSDDELRKRYGQQPAAVHPEAGASETNGTGADHVGELRSQGVGIRPSLRSF